MKLSVYLKERHGRGVELARATGIPTSSITRIAKGHQWPSAAKMRAIRDATHGQVQPNDFYSAEEGKGTAE